MNKIDVKIKKLSNKAIVPTYGTEFSAGADLYAVVENSNNMIEIPSGETRFINTGFALEIPEGYVEQISEIIYQKFKMSTMILDNDYYRKIFK